jgi:hypothetical protein
MVKGSGMGAPIYIKLGSSPYAISVSSYKYYIEQDGPVITPWSLQSRQGRAINWNLTPITLPGLTLWVLLARMQYAKHAYYVTLNAINDDVVWVGYDFPASRIPVTLSV